MSERDVKAIFHDSAEITDRLRLIAASLDGYNHPAYYWMKEAAVHIDGLYADACAMQRTIKRLRLELAKRALEVAGSPDEREAFERHYGPKDSFAWRNNDGSYKVSALQSAWEIWQAAIAHRTTRDKS